MKTCQVIVVLTAALVGLLAFPALASVPGSQAWAAPLRVAEVSLDPSVISPNGDGVADRATLTYSVSARCRARVLVRSGPSIVRELQRWSTTKRGRQTTIWDGRDSKRTAVRAGRYTIEVYVTDVSGRRARPYPLKVVRRRGRVTLHRAGHSDARRRVVGRHPRSRHRCRGAARDAHCRAGDQSHVPSHEELSEHRATLLAHG